MKAFIQSRPVYFLLLPVFFVFHGYTENYNYIPVKDAVVLLLFYLASSLALSFLLWLIYRSISKSCLIAFWLMGFFFFFGSVYDTLDKLAPHSFFSKYTSILSGFFLTLVVLVILVSRYKRSLSRMNYALNVFFICLLFVDAIWLIGKMSSQKKDADTALSKTFSICDSCSRPDIYLILADEYAGNKELKELMWFDNSKFYGELASRGFHSPESLSNYNYTPFSIASMFGMDYLKNIEARNTSHADLSQCYDLIRQNMACDFLERQGYQFFNYSIFDILDQPSLVKESILPERTRFITAQTLFSRLEENILFNMAATFGSGAVKKRLYLSYNSNIRAIGATKNITLQQTSAPRFVYTHLVLPHYPYYFDSLGKEKPMEQIRDGKENDPVQYISYLKYANGIILGLIDTIIHHSKKPPVILLISDHGFREFSPKPDPRYYFMNFISVLMPDKNYSFLYNGITNVNLFRSLFNQQFHQSFALLKDSTVVIDP